MKTSVFDTAVRYSHLGLRLDWVSRDQFRFRGSVQKWMDYLTAEMDITLASTPSYSALALALRQSIDERQTWLRDDICNPPPRVIPAIEYDRIVRDIEAGR